MKIKKPLAVVLAAILVFSISETTTAQAKTFNSRQIERAEIIYEVVSDNWERYGVLPSVCIAQAFIESTLGEHCRGYNYWGISSGAESYSSLENGVYRYMRVINNGYYRGAPFETDPYRQIRKILDGGYCQPEGNYYSNAVWTIDNYDLTEYDRRMFEKIKNRREKKKARQKAKKEEKKKREETQKRRERQKEAYTAVYDETLAPGQIDIDEEAVSGGTVLVGYGFYDVIRHTTHGNTVKTGDKSLDGRTIYFDGVWEEAVG